MPSGFDIFYNAAVVVGGVRRFQQQDKHNLQLAQGLRIIFTEALSIIYPINLFGKYGAPTPPSERNSRKRQVHVPLIGRVPDGPRKHILAVIGEFVGTVLVLLFAYAGTQVAQLDASVPQLQGTVLGDTNKVGTPANTSQLIFIALSFGFSLAVTAWVFFRISGSLFNPAVCVLSSN